MKAWMRAVLIIVGGLMIGLSTYTEKFKVGIIVVGAILVLIGFSLKSTDKIQNKDENEDED